jgi:hypothetical protein
MPGLRGSGLAQLSTTCNVVGMVVLIGNVVELSY